MREEDMTRLHKAIFLSLLPVNISDWPLYIDVKGLSLSFLPVENPDLAG